MAFIYNLKTKLLHECRNADVAKWCKNRPEEYLVSDDKEKLMQVLTLNNALESTEPAKQEKKKSPSQMNLEELKAWAAELQLEIPESLTKAEILALIKEKQGV
ncbi:hypothetical protein [Holdemania filiformis]|uniref:hypothetical protein n=1 Tax=Holdemania filiformis TaxID=61171 RepID=UPI00210D7B98|nr:hypothetical protein [Holdemania filiformis]MCQ4952115.1 hypothetical protein [Holdemania filiformis]